MTMIMKVCILIYLTQLLYVKCHRPHVIVVGAGTSGLAAARTLVDHGGYNVTVLEANPDRYGGRIWTNTDIVSDGSGTRTL